MKINVIFFIFIINIFCLSKDQTLPRYLYIAEISQYKGNMEVDYRPIGIIKIVNNKNEIYKSEIKITRWTTLEGKKIQKMFNDLINIDFSKCNLEWLEDLNNVKKVYPLALIKMENSNDETKKILALINHETYYEKYGEILFYNYVENIIKNKEYFCPLYYNGD